MACVSISHGNKHTNKKTGSVHGGVGWYPTLELFWQHNVADRFGTTTSQTALAPQHRSKSSCPSTLPLARPMRSSVSYRIVSSRCFDHGGGSPTESSAQNCENREAAACGHSVHESGNTERTQTPHPKGPVIAQTTPQHARLMHALLLFQKTGKI